MNIFSNLKVPTQRNVIPKSPSSIEIQISKKAKQKWRAFYKLARMNKF